mmetsp:Transcript_11602/g.48790  ORF Transcript_11602/g.48790 Transcript_11602/m.48790 type:complete len:255 (-) Transcript_11602:209-973(-)
MAARMSATSSCGSTLAVGIAVGGCCCSICCSASWSCSAVGALNADVDAVWNAPPAEFSERRNEGEAGVSTSVVSERPVTAGMPLGRTSLLTVRRAFGSGAVACGMWYPAPNTLEGAPPDALAPAPTPASAAFPCSRGPWPFDACSMASAAARTAASYSCPPARAVVSMGSSGAPSALMRTSLLRRRVSASICSGPPSKPSLASPASACASLSARSECCLPCCATAAGLTLAAPEAASFAAPRGLEVSILGAPAL